MIRIRAVSLEWGSVSRDNTRCVWVMESLNECMWPSHMALQEQKNAIAMWEIFSSAR